MLRGHGHSPPGWQSLYTVVKVKEVSPERHLLETHAHGVVKAGVFLGNGKRSKTYVERRGPSVLFTSLVTVQAGSQGIPVFVRSWGPK